MEMQKAGSTGMIDLDAGSGGLAQLSQFQDQAANRQRYSLFRGHIYSAVNAIAMEAAGQPVHVGKRKKKEKEKKPKDKKDYSHRSKMTIALRAKAARSEMEVIDDHDLLDNLEYPNPIQTKWQFVYSFVANLSLTGWAFIVGGKKNEEKGKGGGYEWYSVPTTWVHPDHSQGAFSRYKIYNPKDAAGAQKEKWILGNQVKFAYLPNPSDPMAGLAPAAAQAAAIRIDEYIQSSQTVFFENGVFPSVIVTVGQNPHPDLGTAGGSRPRLSAPQRRQVYAAIKKVSSGIANYGNPAIVDGLIEKIERLSATQNEMGWEKSEKAVRSRILSAFGVHPFILGEEMAGSYAQAYIVQDRFFKKVNTFLDLLSVVMSGFIGEGELITESEDLMVWWEACKATDPSMEKATWESARKNEDVSQNEFRAWMGLPPDDDDEEAIINASVVPHVAKIAADATAGTITPEQALALLTGLGLPEDVAKEIAGEGPPEPPPGADPALMGAVPGQPGQPPQAPGKPGAVPGKPGAAEPVAAAKPAQPKKPPKSATPAEELAKATESLDMAILQLEEEPHQAVRRLLERASLVDA
jgi:phage portal protein BeeE